MNTPLEFFIFYFTPGNSRQSKTPPLETPQNCVRSLWTFEAKDLWKFHIIFSSSNFIFNSYLEITHDVSLIPLEIPYTQPPSLWFFFWDSPMLMEFSLFHHMLEIFFQFMVFTFLENTLNLCIFYSCPGSPLKTPGRTILKICFPQDGKGGWSYDLLYLNSARKYEDDLLVLTLVYLHFV